jgi:two-component system sensor histidine kinase QseC
MRRLFRQTLARRILVAALLAFALVFVVLAAIIFYQAFRDQDGQVEINRKAFVESLSQALSGYDSEEQVRAAAEGIQRMVEAQMRQAQRPSDTSILVWSRQGRRVYAPIDMPVLRPPELTRTNRDFEWNGQRYIVTSVASAHYTVDVLDSFPIESLYKIVAQDVMSELLVKMAIAFPLILLPIWLAVYTGLRPLGTLSDALRRRPADDMTPIASDMRYEELRPVVQAINDLLERLRRKIQQEQSFVHDAAHELQTPLAVIANQTHVLAAATSFNERVEARRNAEHAIERAGHLVRQMVVLARLDSDRRDELKEFDVAANVRELLAPLVPGPLARSIDLSLDSPDFVPLHGDPGALHSIVGNLVDNALRYIGNGSRIQVAVELCDDIVRLRVIDDGPGIRLEDRARVFDRYYRVPGSGVSGSGLGLAIVKQAVARMHGTISVGDGLLGQGSAFVVELPAHPS